MEKRADHGGLEALYRRRFDDFLRIAAAITGFPGRRRVERFGRTLDRSPPNRQGQVKLTAARMPR